MRWRAVASAALGATAVVCGAVAATAATSGPALAPPPAAASSASAASASAESSFHSVRSYADVAEPVRLRIPAVGIDSALTHLGVAPDRTIEVPTDFATAGWFDQGPRPGQPGPAVILGHVDSKAGPAVFYRLKRVAVGAEVFVDRADGSTIDFRVRSTQHVAKTAFPTDLVYAPTLEPSLRLVTCGGPFDHAKSSYLDNVIVYADP
jgi:sortase (surface protein transpeptidase)